jgi:hypothetical protein
MFRQISILVFLAYASSMSLAKTPATRLACTKSQGANALAELQPIDGIYTLNVTFIGKKPPSTVIDHMLRECLSVATKQQDGTKDILVTPWLRQHASDNENDDSMLHPYGTLTNLIYEASSKSTKLHKIQVRK